MWIRLNKIQFKGINILVEMCNKKDQIHAQP